MIFMVLYISNSYDMVVESLNTEYLLLFDTFFSHWIILGHIYSNIYF